MTDGLQSGAFCKSVCWILGFLPGVAVAYYLAAIVGKSQAESGALGIIIMLATSVLLRLMFCGQTTTRRVQQRVEEARLRKLQALSAKERPVGGLSDAPTGQKEN